MRRMELWVQAQLLSNWIELFAVPIATCIMLAQPIVVLLIFSSPIFTEEFGKLFLGEGTIILLLLGLQWWAMFVKRGAAHGLSENSEKLLYILGLLVAATLVVATPLLMVRNILTLILSSALIVWFWWRGMHRAEVGLSDEYLVRSFRIGFAILLIALLFAVFYLDPTNNTLFASPDYTPLFTALAQALPLFFLSGLLGLSFTRIGLIRQQNARYSSEGSQLGSTRNWLIFLTLFWIGTVAAVIALEAFSFQSIRAVITLLWNGLGTLVTWLLTAIIFLLSPLFYLLGAVFAFLARFFKAGTPTLPSYPNFRNSVPPHQQPFSPEALLIGRFVLLLLAFAVLLLIVRAALRKWRRTHKDNEVEEIREGLSVHSLVKARREERQSRDVQQNTVSPLEVLDPTSARAYYRELLQAMASNQAALARRSDETPGEYQARLVALVQQASSDEAQEEIPPDPAILDELTHDYVLERYGGKHLDQEKQAYLRKWVPRLLERLTKHNVP